MRKKLLIAIAFAMGIWAYLLLLAATPRQAPAAAAPPPVTMGPEEGMTVLFSPGGGCTDAIIAEVTRATKTIDIQAYAFTSSAIAQAVVDAHDRGVRVRIMLDKGQRADHYSSATFFQNHHVPTYIDDQHAIAHSKVMMIDHNVLITGSFNFTKASEERNSENLLIIRGRPKLLAAYEGNFTRHLDHSVPLAVPSK